MSQPLHILVVEARVYTDIADELAKGAIEALSESGVRWQRLAVPGAFEIPSAIEFALRAMEAGTGRIRFDGFIALGCVIRGETTHYDYVCQESARGLMQVALARGAVVVNGILTVENGDQAWERARVDRKNKGGDVARACLRMIEIKRSFGLG